MSSLAIGACAQPAVCQRNLSIVCGTAALIGVAILIISAATGGSNFSVFVTSNMKAFVGVTVAVGVVAVVSFVASRCLMSRALSTERAHFAPPVATVVKTPKETMIDEVAKAKAKWQPDRDNAWQDELYTFPCATYLIDEEFSREAIGAVFAALEQDPIQIANLYARVASVDVEQGEMLLTFLKTTVVYYCKVFLPCIIAKSGRFPKDETLVCLNLLEGFVVQNTRYPERIRSVISALCQQCFLDNGAFDEVKYLEISTFINKKIFPSLTAVWSADKMAEIFYGTVFLSLSNGVLHTYSKLIELGGLSDSNKYLLFSTQIEKMYRDWCGKIPGDLHEALNKYVLKQILTGRPCDIFTCMHYMTLAPDSSSQDFRKFICCSIPNQYLFFGYFVRYYVYSHIEKVLEICGLQTFLTGNSRMIEQKSLPQRLRDIYATSRDLEVVETKFRGCSVYVENGNRKVPELLLTPPA